MEAPSVLLIEGVEDHATVVAGYLKRRMANINLLHANDFDKGLDLLSVNQVDVLLWGLTHQIPTLKKYLELVVKKNPAVPILVLGSRDNEKQATRTLMLGAQGYILKEELTADSLVRAIRHAMERKILEFKLAQFSDSLAKVDFDLERRVAARTRSLIQSEKQSRSLMHFAPVGIVTLAQSSKIIYANAKFRHMFGFGNSNLQTLAFPTLIHQDDLLSFGAKFRHLLKHAGRVCKHTLRLINKHKCGKWCRVTITAVCDDAGKFSHYLCLIDDLSERKMHEQLEKEKRIAELASQAKTAFLTNISHEIRTPLAAITGFIDLIISHNDDPKLVPHLDIVKRNSNHLISLMNDLLDLSKIDTGQLDVNVTEFCLIEEVNTVLSTVRAAADAKGLKLKIKYNGMIPLKVHSDPQKLRQILINLINNAIKYTEKGQILVTFHVKPADDGQTALLIVTILDTGIGVAKDSVPCLFQPFKRGGDARVLEKQGLGIGLALSRNLARSLGGDITLISTGNQGSKFRLTLEVGKMDELAFIKSQHRKNLGDPNGSQPKESKASERFHLKLSGKSILVAEDAVDMQLLIRHYLTMAGADVTMCGNGEEAIRLASLRRFDAILMDIQMPKVNGYEATRCLKGQGYSGKIIALTAHAFREEREYCLSLGFDGFLTKPIVADEMIATLVAQTRQTIPLESASRSSKSKLIFPKAHPAEGLPADVVSDPIIREAALRFFSSFDKKVATFEQALTKADWDTVARLAHQIKGSSGSLGFAKIADLAHALEDQAKNLQDEKKGLAMVQKLSQLSQAASESLHSDHL